MVVSNIHGDKLEDAVLCDYTGDHRSLCVGIVGDKRDSSGP